MNKDEYQCCYCGTVITLDTAQEHQKDCNIWQFYWGKKK